MQPLVEMSNCLVGNVRVTVSTGMPFSQAITHCLAQYCSFAALVAQGWCLVHSGVASFLTTLFFDEFAPHDENAVALSFKVALQARHFANRSQIAAAEVLYEFAIDLATRANSSDSPHVAICCHHLADIYADRQNYEAAAPLYLRSINIWEQTYGGRHKVVGLALHAYSQVLVKVGRCAEAELTLSRSRDILQGFRGINAAEMAGGMELLKN